MILIMQGVMRSYSSSSNCVELMEVADRAAAEKAIKEQVLSAARVGLYGFRFEPRKAVLVEGEVIAVPDVLELLQNPA